MQLTISQRETQGVTVLDLAGRVTLGEECNTLRDTLKKLLAGGQKRILLNLKEVNRVDSSGIGILVEGVILAAKDDAALKLVNLDRVVYNVLRTHRLLAAFEVFDTEPEALASFQ